MKGDYMKIPSRSIVPTLMITTFAWVLVGFHQADPVLPGLASRTHAANFNHETWSAAPKERLAGTGTHALVFSCDSPVSGNAGLTWDGSRLWIADYDTQRAYKVDPSNCSSSFSIPLPGTYPFGLAWDGHYIWQADADMDTIYKLNPSNGDVLASFASPGEFPSGLAWENGHLWNADMHCAGLGCTPTNIYKLSASGNLLATFASKGSVPTGLAFDGKYLWHSDNGTQTIYKLDPQDLSIIDSFPSPGPYPNDLAWDGKYLWVVDNWTDKLYKYDTGSPPISYSIEINQALGNQYQNGKKFVAGKDTALILYLNTPLSINSSSQQIEILRDGAYVTTLLPSRFSRNPTVMTFLCPNRSACDDWKAGDYTFNASINGTVGQATATFETRKGLRILAVPVKVKDQGVVTFLPDDQWKTAWRFMEKVYPVARQDIDWVIDDNELDATGLDLTNAFGQSALWWKLSNKQPFLCGKPFRPACFDKIVGFIPPMPICGINSCVGTGCVLGWTKGSPANIVMVNGSFERPSDHKTINIQSMQTVIAHEIGHTFELGDEYNQKNGLFKCDINPPPASYWGRTANSFGCNNFSCPASGAIAFSNPNVGTGSTVLSLLDHPFDINGMGQLDDRLSFMGTGGAALDTYWITPRIYDHLFDQLDPWAHRSVQAPQSNQEVLEARGWIGQDDSITIDPWVHFFTTPDPAISGAYSIEALDALSQTLATQGFDISFITSDNPPVEIDPAPFRVALPFPPGTTAFRIKHAGNVIRVVPVSLSTPDVSIISPNGAEVWSGSGNYSITWEGSDPDNDAIHYTVLFSPDGVSWITLATDIETTNLMINSAVLPGGDQAKIQVIATDGVNTSLDESDQPFTVGKKAPQAFILSPNESAVYSPEASFFLEGYAYDLEDGALGETAFQWESDLDGILGTGRLLLVNLSPGSHLITMRATDRDGFESTESNSIQVEYRLFLPLTLRSN
jgi:sugar lactone lactonase YvrE